MSLLECFFFIMPLAPLNYSSLRSREHSICKLIKDSDASKKMNFNNSAVMNGEGNFNGKYDPFTGRSSSCSRFVGEKEEIGRSRESIIT